MQEAERREREELRQNWVTQQEKIKCEPPTVMLPCSRILILSYSHFTAEEIQITYSYWDGSGHRRNVKVIYEEMWGGREGGSGEERERRGADGLLSVYPCLMGDVILP